MITSHRDARRDADVWLPPETTAQKSTRADRGCTSCALVRGVAYSGSGRSISSVEVRVGGEDEEWRPAVLLDHCGGGGDHDSDNDDGDDDNDDDDDDDDGGDDDDDDSDGNRFSWTRWEIEVTVPAEAEAARDETTRLCCRATDSKGNTQPSSPAEAVAAETSGYLYNACHCVDVRLEELREVLQK